MKRQKRKWDLLSKDQRQAAINKIITFFAESRDETIGIIQAEEVLDFFLQIASADLYNLGVSDTKALLHRRIEDIQVDLDLLKK